MLLPENFLQTAWQIQIKYGQDKIRAVHYNLNVPYLLLLLPNGGETSGWCILTGQSDILNRVV